MFQHPGDASGGRRVTNNAWNTHMSSFKCWRSPDCHSSKAPYNRSSILLHLFEETSLMLYFDFTTIVA